MVEGVGRTLVALYELGIRAFVGNWVDGFGCGRDGVMILLGNTGRRSGVMFG